MRNIRITLAYDGTNYYGWQVQPGFVTVQQVVEDVLTRLNKNQVHVVASGRTDAGVHAYGQVIAFPFENPIPCGNLRRAMNRRLPGDIRVLDVREAPEGFHPRYQAAAKTYEYRIHRPEICLPFERNYVYHHPYPLDEARMCAAARVFEGEHNFTAFAAADEKDKLGYSKVRRIFSSTLTREGNRLIYRVRGSGFLKHMVRNLVGALLEVGRGNLSAAGLQAYLEPGCKGRAGATAPPQGLFLVSVEYEEPEAGIIL